MKQIVKCILQSITFLFTLSSLLIISCESKEIASGQAYEIAKESKAFTDDSLELDSVSDFLPIAEPPLKYKLVIVDSWNRYEKEMEIKIKANEKSISELKAITGSNIKTLKKIIVLEKANLDLQNSLAGYRIKSKSELEKFKSELLLELNELIEDVQILSASVKSN